MDKLKLDKITLKHFELTMGGVFLVFSGVFFIKQKLANLNICLVISSIFFLVGLIAPGLLKVVYIIWMRLAFILGCINTRIILTIMFYLIFTPIGLLMRLLRIIFLEKRNKSITYWKIKEKTDSSISNYERRF